ncbi:MAG: methylated-DNA--[protein]-cysteine S-methyltransferase [Chloroflexi bacterium]|nr:methylated-DNA--[protein]-cysteine S-methyltransferase [Chloroflexota bacterium]
MPSVNNMQTTFYIGKAAPTPLGAVWVAVTARGLAALEIRAREDEFAHKLAKRYGVEVTINEASTAETIRQVRGYLAGERESFDLSIDWSVMSAFQERVLRAVYAIPRGETRSYGEIAAQIGKPGAARAVGRANATNPMPLVIPCHRVIGADGGLRGYSGGDGLETKAWLLELEKH